MTDGDIWFALVVVLAFALAFRK